VTAKRAKRRSKDAPATAAATKSGATRTNLWVDASAFVAALLTTVAVSRLFLFGPSFQCALVAGVAAGLIATKPLRAALAGLVAAGLGLSLVLGTIDPAVAVVAAGAAVVAWGVCALASRRPSAASWVTWAVVVLIVANMWATTFVLATRTTPKGLAPIITQLSISPKPGLPWTDEAFYRRVLWLMDGGEDYYVAFRQAYHENSRWKMDPSSVVSYRLPTVFWLWHSIPGRPWGLVVAWLVVASATIFAAVRLASLRIALPLGLIPAATLASYFIWVGTDQAIMMTETWAVPFAVLSVMAAVESLRHDRWREWTVAAVAFALMAALTRELMVFLFVAGLVASAFTGRERRRFQVLAWISGILAFVAAYALHAWRVGSAVSHVQSASIFMQGGWAFVVAAFRWSSNFVGGGMWTLVILCLMAILGAALVPARAEKVFAILVVSLPLAAFLVFGNGAYEPTTGRAVNYWGPIVVPILVAMSPWAFAVVPQLRRGPETDPATSQVTESRN
jgi:hypothetical protein